VPECAVSTGVALVQSDPTEDGTDASSRSAKRRGTEPAIVDHAADRKSTPRAPKQEAFVFTESHSGKPYQMPDIDLFEKPASAGRTYDRESLIMNSRILEKKLRDFGVLGRVVTVHPGPVITMYEFEPASGVKINRIVNLSDDLALALRALSIRIIAPIPGKSVVGIEVPNPEREIVSFRDLLESENFRSSRSRLTLALGKDIFGNPVEADLARMPHLLVAGATGTGKSVFLNSLLCSILFRATPDELKLLLVDPKLLELSMYEGIPHLIADVVTNPKRAAAALAGIVHKMEERYQMMAALGVRSIDQFNGRVDEELAAGKATFRLKPKPGETEGREVPYQRLPYIVVVIDELADLMVVSARDVEEALQRLAQMARAAGIHLVLATQRPSVDVLTGVIKANFPARLSFQVSSRTDSRTILDQNGAETLLGQGDMLFLPPGTSKLQRIHGAYVSEKEVGRLVSFLREQGQPQFDEKLLELDELSEVKEERGEDVDEMYDRAIAIVTETRNASISYLQRRLKVGYNRAARMIEQMETDGVIGPQEGTKPREVFARAVGEL
jgi:S-DNA-T family DNA segregation ATPase FtsK/SpoIIIE